MEGRVFMGTKDISRLEIITKVIEKRLAIAQAAQILGLSRRKIGEIDLESFSN